MLVCMGSHRVLTSVFYIQIRTDEPFAVLFIDSDVVLLIHVHDTYGTYSLFVNKIQYLYCLLAPSIWCALVIINVGVLQ